MTQGAGRRASGPPPRGLGKERGHGRIAARAVQAHGRDGRGHLLRVSRGLQDPLPFGRVVGIEELHSRHPLCPDPVRTRHIDRDHVPRAPHGTDQDRIDLRDHEPLEGAAIHCLGYHESGLDRAEPEPDESPRAAGTAHGADSSTGGRVWKGGRFRGIVIRFKNINRKDRGA